MGRYIISMIWAMVFMSIVGFIASALTSTTYNPIQSLVIGAVFGLLFSVIIPRITAKSHHDDSKYSKL